jgi:hemin uptake protein HemP
MNRQSVDTSNTVPALTRGAGTNGRVGARMAPSQFSRPQTLESRDLLAGQPSVLIRHLGEVYRLQTTRQGKLILTK